MQSRRVDFKLYLITDRKLFADAAELFTAVEEALRGGVRAVQLREKDLAVRDVLEMAYMMRELTNRYNAKLFINDRVDVAMAVNADGVHLVGAGIPPQAARKAAGDALIDLRVASGSHSQHEVPDDRPPGHKIAVILLTPGNLSDIRPFLEYLPVAVADVRFIAKPTDVADILKGLFRISPAAHDRACLVLAEQFWEQDACLLDLRDSPDSEVRAAARAILLRNERGLHSIIRRLHESPFNVHGSSSDPTDELKMLLGCGLFTWKGGQVQVSLSHRK